MLGAGTPFIDDTADFCKSLSTEDKILIDNINQKRKERIFSFFKKPLANLFSDNEVTIFLLKKKMEV